MSPLVAGVDRSTQATKVLVVDPDTGSVEATGRGAHAVTGTGGARETEQRRLSLLRCRFLRIAIASGRW